MNKSFLLFLFVVVIFQSGCEDVIDLELDGEQERVIVQALIEVDTSEELTFAAILFRKTALFAEDDGLQGAAISDVTLENTVTGELIIYGSNSGIGQFNPIEGQESQVSEQKIETSFFTTADAEFILRFDYKNNSYIAYTRFFPSSPVTISQTEVVSDLEREITVRFEDIKDQENYYIVEFDGRNFLPVADRFFENGEAIISITRSLEDTDGSTTEAVRNIGADEQLYNYINAILEQSNQDDPTFQTPRTTIRGNVIQLENGVPTQNLDNFALGYFAISQKYRDEVTIE